MKAKMIIPKILLFLFAFGTISAQEPNQQISDAEKTEVIDSISRILMDNYVFPEIAEKIIVHLQQKKKDGEYNHITDSNTFAQVLTNDVRSVNNDLHLRVMFAPERIQAQKNAITKEDSLALVEQRIRQGKLNNFGFQKIEFLEGNIGYLNLTGFHDTEHAAETATAAMNYLSNSDALIIDLRQNGGGSPKMIQLITSYLYGPDPVHLNNFYWRPQDLHTQTWTLPYVPGNRRPDMDVYVLTSKRTFSAAEEFSYNLRNLERATLIGETTGGGAHPGGTNIATDRFAIWVPSGKAINPITNDNWEGVGVKPHIETKADDALATAHKEAIKGLMAKHDGDEQFVYEWVIEGLEAEQNPVEIEGSLLRSYAGDYGPRHITYEDGKLYYQRDGRSKYEMLPMSKDLFRFDEIAYFRIKMIKEADQVITLEGRYNDGRTDKNMKDSLTP